MDLNCLLHNFRINFPTPISCTGTYLQIPLADDNSSADRQAEAGRLTSEHITRKESSQDVPVFI